MRHPCVPLGRTYTPAMPWQPPQEPVLDPAAERHSRITQRLTFAVVAILVALVAYLGYVAWEGSRQLVEPTHSADCRTPALMGWAYEAINYDIATDASLGAEPDPVSCVTPPTPAGDALVTSDGIRIAGWYVPAASGIGPHGPTVVLAHGWSANKSDLLERMAMLHDTYNLVAFDFRNHGQSSVSATTQGDLEQRDLRAVLGWLEGAKGPQQVALLGVSMGGATVANVAASDDSVDAVILDSTHATLANAIGARLRGAGYPLELPGSWAILMGGLVRTGQDMSAADPVQAVERLGERPLLVIEAQQDASVPPGDAEDIVAAAQAADVEATLETCGAAAHGATAEACPGDYAGWVLGFLAQALDA